MKRKDLSVGQRVAYRGGNKQYIRAEQEQYWTYEAVVLALDVRAPRYSRWAAEEAEGITYKVGGKTYLVPKGTVSAIAGDEVLICWFYGKTKSDRRYEVVRLATLKGEWTTWKADLDSRLKAEADYKAQAERDKRDQHRRRKALAKRLNNLGVDVYVSEYDSKPYQLPLSLDDIETLLGLAENGCA